MARKYLFADESGNLDFRDHEKYAGPTKHFAVGTILFEDDDDRRALEVDLLDLRRTMIRNGLPIKSEFHATEDKQAVRDGVFEVLAKHNFVIDVTIMEKAKSLPRLRLSEATFYKYAWYYHFKYFAGRSFQPDDDLTVMAATLGTKAKQRDFRKAVEEVVTQCADLRIKRRVVCYPSAADLGLQAADYALWAVMRDVERVTTARES